MICRIIRIGFLILICSSFAMIGYVFDEDKEVALGVKIGGIIAKKKLGISNPTRSEINFLLYNPDNETFKQLKNGNKVATGQQFMINIRCNKKVYFYILNIDGSNKIYKFYPHPNIEIENPVKAKKALFFPTDAKKSDGSLFTFTDDLGLENFYVFISKKRIPSLDKLIKRIPITGIKLDGDAKKVIADLGSKRGFVILAKNKSKKIVKKTESGKKIKIHSQMVWFKYKYAKKLVLIHVKSPGSSVNKKLVQKAKEEEWEEENLLDDDDKDD